MNIKSDGTYTITETYTSNGYPGQMRTFSNYWQYVTDNPGGATFFLNGIVNTTGQTPFLFSIFDNSPLFQVSQLTDNSMQLTDNWSNTSTTNPASGQTNSFVMNFSK